MIDLSPVQRADLAAETVTAFGSRLWFLPLTHVAHPQRPWSGRAGRELNYWWQAHYLDAIVDAGERERDAGRTRDAARWHRLGMRLVRGVWLRNGRTWHNHFYDDMGWMSLATLRLDALGRSLGYRPSRVLAGAQRVFAKEFEGAADCPGGGCWWNKDREVANVPSTAPIGLWSAWTGREGRARAHADWIVSQLVDPETGLVLDGIAERDGERVVERGVYTYNQGTALGLLLALGQPDDLRVAARIVAAVAEHLTVAPRVLRTSGGGDGGLFTGILCRYLALAADDERLDGATRDTAAAMVRGTAEALWGSHSRRPSGAAVFSPDAEQRAADAIGGGPVELTPQVQAWTVLEAAARLAR